MKILTLAAICSLAFTMSSICEEADRTEKINKGDFFIIKNKGGKTLGLSAKSGVKLIYDDGFAFKDLNRNGELDVYEDWRLSVEERAIDLAKKMSVEQIAGLMCYSRHQAIPKKAKEGEKLISNAKASELRKDQKEFLRKDRLRHILITRVQSPELAAKWNNNLQAFVEGLGLGIPANNSSDPRHISKRSNNEFVSGAGGHISLWPKCIGIAATFDPETMRHFGQIASIEYRALGIATALSPQVDLSTDPRWLRFSFTMGEDPNLVTDMTRAYIEGFQTTSEATHIADGWGYQSVNAMVKHWPGGGSGEGGRDAHFGYGAFAVFPGDNIDLHMKPFLAGAFNLNDPTKKAAAVMPYYTVSYNQDKKYGENVGNAFSKYFINDLLRIKHSYDGVLCTDWRIIYDMDKININSGKSWGVEHLSVPERAYKVLMAGMDQFGGSNESTPILGAYEIGKQKNGEEFMRTRFELSAKRLLKNIFQVGLFENPYLDPEITKKIVGNAEFMAVAYQTQLRSIVLLKNQKNILPLKTGTKIYIPKENAPDKSLLANFTKHFLVTEKPAEADAALVFIESPFFNLRDSGAYSTEDKEKGGNGYIPISLQYRPYTAEYAREKSIAAGLAIDGISNRSYKDKTAFTKNEKDLDQVLETKKLIGDKPLIVVINASNPLVVSEFEKQSSAILMHFHVQNQAILETIVGINEPSALLPFQMPADMKAVEEQLEDRPRDMRCYKDSDGNVYDFAFGLNWKGVIDDERVRKYR